MKEEKVSVAIRYQNQLQKKINKICVCMCIDAENNISCLFTANINIQVK